MANIPIDRLADELVQAVKEYTDDVAAGVRKTVDKTARKVLQETKALAPKRTGEYARTFTITKEDGYGTTRRIIWNKNIIGVFTFLSLDMRRLMEVVFLPTRIFVQHTISTPRTLMMKSNGL
jgi:Bacteriophage protein of unknown function (DUF646).